MKHVDFLAEVLGLVGTPYLWGGKSPSGIDCSGVVTFGLWKVGGPDWRRTYSSERLWTQLEPIRFPRSGDLAFYGKSPRDISHVMVVLPLDWDALGSSDESEASLVVGACGGDSRTTTLAEAQRRGARVQVKRGIHYRDDFRGFRKLPID